MWAVLHEYWGNPPIRDIYNMVETGRAVSSVMSRKSNGFTEVASAMEVTVY